MDEHTIKQRIKLLVIIFSVSFALYNLCSNIYFWYCKIVLDYNAIHMLSGLQLTTLATVLFLFLPLLLQIKYYCKAAKMREVYIIVSAIVIFYSIWAVLMVIATILALVFPSYFT